MLIEIEIQQFSGGLKKILLKKKGSTKTVSKNLPILINGERNSIWFSILFMHDQVKCIIFSHFQVEFYFPLPYLFFSFQDTKKCDE